MTRSRTRSRSTTKTRKHLLGAAAGPPAGAAARSIGARLRELRVQRKMSQGEIEERTGLLRCYISRVEGGYTVPSVGTLEKFAAALAVPLHVIFLRGKGSPKQFPASSRETPARREAPDALSGKLRRLIRRMDPRERDTFLSIVRKLAVLEV